MRMPTNALQATARLRRRFNFGTLVAACLCTSISLQAKTMKTSKAVFFLLLFAGMFLIAFFGAGISRSLKPANSWAGDLLLPGFSLGLILISGSMFLELTCRLGDVEARIQKLENKSS